MACVHLMLVGVSDVPPTLFLDLCFNTQASVMFLLKNRVFSCWRNDVIRLRDLLKLPKQMPEISREMEDFCWRKTSVWICFPVHAASAHCSEFLNCVYRCFIYGLLPKQLYDRKSRLDYKKISGILSNLHHVSTLNQQRTAFPKCLWHLVAEKHKNPNASILWSVIHHMTADWWSADLLLLALWQFSASWNNGGLRPLKQVSYDHMGEE